VTAVLTLHAIEELAARIERAYCLRHPGWQEAGSYSRVWQNAASALMRAHRDDPRIPLDPELFVAAQHLERTQADPWQDLTPARAARRYRRRVYQIIRMLRGELRAELRMAESRLLGGEALETILVSKSRSLTPLARYIVAFRAGRLDLAERFREQAHDQHYSCPLYRHACRRLMPSAAYPVVEVVSGLELPGRLASAIPQFSLN
jgi:hypothetical protein